MVVDEKQTIRIATKEDFLEFSTLADSVGLDWKLEYEKAGIKIESQWTSGNPVKLFRAQTTFSNVKADVLYDVLHDADYRQVWDENMIDGYELFVIDQFNDVGYYSAHVPVLKNRDFLNQRSWQIDGGDNSIRQYIIMNHSVEHPFCEPKKKFVRGWSHLTGYLVRPQEDNEDGCTLVYVTQSDIRGSVPKWLINRFTAKIAPTIINKLYKAASAYSDWKAEHSPDLKPWFDITQHKIPRYDPQTGLVTDSEGNVIIQPRDSESRVETEDEAETPQDGIDERQLDENDEEPPPELLNEHTGDIAE